MENGKGPKPRHKRGVRDGPFRTGMPFSLRALAACEVDIFGATPVSGWTAFTTTLTNELGAGRPHLPSRMDTCTTRSIYKSRGEL